MNDQQFNRRDFIGLSAQAAGAFMLLLIFSLPGVAQGRVVVNAETTLLIDGGEPAPLQKAAADLAADFERVFGRRVKIVHDPAHSGASVIWIALDHNVPNQVARPSGWERLRIQAVENPGSGSVARNAVVLTGSDVRGAIYAVYQFSRQFLGVDPFYWWTDHAPQHRSEVALPDGFSLTDGPTFHYRGWFINDEDLLTGWTPGAADNTGISLSTWDHIFEAILRLKGDMVIPGTFIFPYEPQIRAAGERGLIVTQHHVNTLGLDAYRWPSEKPMSYFSNPTLLESAWKRAMGQYPKGAEILWSVGVRGKNDQPFWADDPKAPASDEGRAQLIRAAIDRQVDIVRAEYPQAELFMNAWGEGAPFIQQGLLKLPDSVTLIWTDGGTGTIDDKNALARGEGVYYHTAMYGGVFGHYSEMIPLERVQLELGRAATAGATRMLLINTANIRPVVMTTQAAMELAWSPTRWTGPNAKGSSEYLDEWSRGEFGARAARAVAEYYKAYFDAPAQYTFAPGESMRMGDEFYHSSARLLLVASLQDTLTDTDWFKKTSDGEHKDAEEFASALLKACGAADGKWQRAKLLAERAKTLVAKDRMDFFQANILTQVDLHLHFNRMLLDLARTVRESDRQAKIKTLRSAINDAEMAAAAMRAAEYGKWREFYTAGDWLLNTPEVIALARIYLDQLEGRQPASSRETSWTDYLAPWISGYHRITAYQGAQTVQF